MKMKRKRIVLGLVLILVINAVAYNQKKWSLEDCINYALENNIQIKRQVLQAEIAEQNNMQSKYELLPNLNAGLDHTFSSGRSLNTETYNWEDRKNQDGRMGMSSDLVIFNGFKNYNNIEKTKYDLMSTLSNVDKVKNDISLQIATSYLQILFDEELLEIAKSQLEVTQLHVSKMEKMVEVGNRAKGDLLDIIAQSATEKLQVTNANNQLKLSILNLTQLLDLDSVGDFSIAIPANLNIEEYNLPTLDVLFNNALTNFPQIKSSEYYVKSNEKSLAIAKADRYPSLNLNSLYYTRYNKLATDPVTSSADYSYSNQIGDNQYRSLTLSLSVPIFNRRQVYRNVSNAKISLHDSKYRLNQTKQVLYKEIQQAYADAVAALEKYYSAREAVVSNEEAFKYTEQKFNVGLLSSIEFNEAKNNLTRAKSELTQAKYEYIFKSKILDFYKGEAISL